MVVVTVRGASYYMDAGLKEKWDNLKDGKLKKYDEDRFYIVDGTERVGKSLFTIQQAAYIDETILDDEDGVVLPRICFTAKEFLEAIRNTRSTDNHTKVVIFDESFRGLSSKGALSKTNKLIVQGLMEAGQNNLVVFIVSPSFYLIEFYAAVLRCQALFHVVKDKNTKRRYVRVFGKKAKAELYQIGVRKGWGYPRKTRIRVSFFNIYPNGDEFETKYRKKKFDSLRDTDKEEKLTHRWHKQRDILLKVLHSNGFSYQKIREEMEKHGGSISVGQISSVVGGAYVE